MGYQQQKKSEAFRGREISRETSLVSRLLRAYTAQLETLRRLRNGGTQLVRVEHVHVNEGAQAIIGNVRSGTAGEEHPSSRMSNEVDDDRMSEPAV